MNMCKDGIIRIYKTLAKFKGELMKVDTFEQFLNTQYKTTKRFGVDGGEATDGTEMISQDLHNLDITQRNLYHSYHISIYFRCRVIIPCEKMLPIVS